MASINDVAKAAKVAKSTVSLVLNNSEHVSEETRKRVEEAIRKLDYHPSQLARNLSRKKTNLIGIVIPDASHPFYGTFLKYAEEALYRRGYKTLLCETVERENLEEEFISMLKRHTIDGIIMGAHSLIHNGYNHLGKPVVAFDRKLAEDIPIVRADHEGGGRLAAAKLLEKGCKKVVQVSGSGLVNTPAHKYHVTFEEELRKNGVNVIDVEMPHNAFGETDFLRTAEKIFREYQDFDAIFGADMVIQACLREARIRNIRVPEDCRMLAYDGTYITRMCGVPINSVVQPIGELADACVAYIDKIINGEEVDEFEKIIPVAYQEGDTL
ncbi:MAG: LacI family DNA-binding transcriptional regulator [Lachnospiraceae bacterium]|nr:LacI family DNA-binding transcriptional regulator [Lachnospiraceae bacterium]